jgi:branched-chain amino acid transport system permease protein
MIGAALAGIAGGLVGAMFVVEPTMGLQIVVKAFIVVIVGGIGSIEGSIIAGFGLALIETLAGALLPAEFIDIVGFSVMIVVLLTKPTGFFGVKAVCSA